MDFKRVQSSPMQSPSNRGNPLIQPLINISKASTPVRTRVVNNAGPMNSTPVNVNKIPQKIPLASNSNSNIGNKENQTHNIRYATSYQSNSTLYNMRRNTLGCDTQDIHLAAKEIIINGHNRANLSPVLALNRKIKQGPSYSASKNSRQFEASPAKISARSYSRAMLQQQNNQHHGASENSTAIQNQEYYQFNQPSRSPQRMLGSKQYYSNNSNNNLQSSNSFKTMLESKNKTPPRLGSMAFTGLTKKQSSNSSNNSLRTSLSTNSILASIGGAVRKGSQKKLLESGSQQKILAIRSPQKQNFPLCRNQDGNKAKYKVVGVDGDYQDDGQILAYCTDCSRAVIQNGFKVQQISQSDMNLLNRQQKNVVSQIRSPRQQNRSVSPIHVTIDQAHRLKQGLVIKMQELHHKRKNYTECYMSQLDKVDSFYNSVIELIEQQRVADRQAIISVRDKNKLLVNQFESQIHQTLCRVEQLLQTLEGDQNPRHFRNTLAVKSQLNEYEELLCKEMPISIYKDLILGDVQEQYDTFADIFYNQLKLNINGQIINSIKGKLSNSNSKNHQSSNSNAYTRNQKSTPRQDSRDYQSQGTKHNSLRFSFQKMVAAKNKPFLNPSMNTLAEENQSFEEQDSYQKQHKQIDKKTYENQYQQNAVKQPFRDLFSDQEPEFEQINSKKPIVSPTFKNI